ncbi:MAG: hypothetical protein RIR52_1701, partial [Acidobacteriota bacterium]
MRRSILAMVLVAQLVIPLPRA